MPPSDTVTARVPKLDPIPALEESRLKKELKIERRARQEGAHNQPETNAADLNQTEQSIVDRCQHGIDMLQQWAVRESLKCANQLPHTDAGPGDFLVDDVKADVNLKIATLKAEAKDELVRLRIAERQLLRERRLFQQENHLNRSAHYPSSQLFPISLLAAMMIAEAVANAYLFARGNPFGLLGGWLQALIVSLANVVVSFVFGMFVLRNIHHVQWVRKSIALLLLPLGLATLGGFNLAVAHYRDLLEIDPVNALIRTLTALRTHPFELTNFESIILLMVGIVICVFATWDGYGVVDDHYPGYGRLDRRYAKAARQYDARKGAFRQAILLVMDKALLALGERTKRIGEKVDHATNLLKQSVLIVRMFGDSADQTAKLGQRLLKLYREANAKVRTTDAPAYFARYPQFAVQAIQAPVALREQRDSLQEGLDGMKSAANNLCTELQRVVEDEIAQLFQMVDEIEKLAEEKLKREKRFLEGPPAAAV